MNIIKFSENFSYRTPPSDCVCVRETLNEKSVNTHSSLFQNIFQKKKMSEWFLNNSVLRICLHSGANFLGTNETGRPLKQPIYHEKIRV